MVCSLCLLCFASLSSAQRFVEPTKLKQFNITINFDDYTVKTQMLSQNKPICVSNDKVYMWYGSQKLIETKGGYDGRLIHGTYNVFYLSGQLKEQGRICYGLRNKQWKYWYADGRLKEVITWKKGVKNGNYYLYNDYGQLMAKSRFRDDKLHGYFFTYDASGKVLDKKRYRRGDEVVKVPKAQRKKAKPAAEKKNRKSGSEEQVKEEKTKTPFLKKIFSGKKKKKDKGQTPEEHPNIKSTSM